MNLVIFAGGLGTRISEESDYIPKPMVKIGKKPILWHIIKYYSVFGFSDFIICGGYKINIIKKYENRISKWISEPDNGMFDALNKGMKMATGDVIGVLHSDDVFASDDVLETIANIFQTKNVDTLYGDLNYVYEDDIFKIYRKWEGKPFDRNLFKTGWMPAHPAFYFKRALLEKYGDYEIEFYSASDYEFMARYLYKHNLSTIYIPKLIIRMRRGGLSNNNFLKRIEANRNDYRAMKVNGIPFPLFVSILKPLSKLHQYFKK
jgi:glycosyltransferase